MPLPYIALTPRPRINDSERPAAAGSSRENLSQGGRVSDTPISYPLEFGIYRDGDNNLDEVQSAVLDQAVDVSAQNHDVAFNVEDTTQRDDGTLPPGILHTEDYTVVDGQEQHIEVRSPENMAAASNLAKFVAHTLDQAEQNHSSQTWLDLVDHGGGDGGGLQTDSSGGKVMREDDISRAIASGIRMHAQAHPEDGQRIVDGVIANQCLMATLGMEYSLSQVGVKFLAASPETMIAPGVPTQVANTITQNPDDPHAMASQMVKTAMHAKLDIDGTKVGTAAAFDVFSLDPQKISTMEHDVTELDSALTKASTDTKQRNAIRGDARDIEGMTRGEGKGLPWHADRPALELYSALAGDQRLAQDVRAAAQAAHDAVQATILAHGESSDFPAFGDADYRDAKGPTVHFPITPHEVDPWAPKISETDNAFFHEVGADKLARALA